MKKLLTPKWIFTSLLVLLAVGVLMRLGFWQLDRLELRRSFNAHYLEVVALPPLEISAAPALDLPTMEYRAATASGVYDHENQVALRNQYNDLVFGYHLITPLVLSDGTAILVDRGWIWPAATKPPPTGANTISPASKPSAAFYVWASNQKWAESPIHNWPRVRPASSFWNNLNLARIASQIPSPLLPVYLQPEPGPQNSQPPIIPARPEIEISEGSHQSYAMQWFSFAAMLFLGYPFFLRKQLTEKK